MAFRRKGIGLLALLVALVRPGAAATPLQSLRAVPDITANVGGVTVLAGRVAQDSLSGNVTLVTIPDLVDGEHVDAYEVLPNGDQLLSFDVTVGLPGAVVAGPADVVRLSGGAYSIEFDASTHGISAGVNTDAVAMDGGTLLLSFDTTVGVGGLTVERSDVVARDGGSFTLRFDAGAAGMAGGLDLDALDSVGSHLLISFDGSGSVGGVTFDKDDVLEYDPGNGMWEKAYDASAAHGDYARADLIALAAEPVPPSATPSGTPTSTPTASPTASPTLTSSPAHTPTLTIIPTLPPVSTPTATTTATQTPSVTSTPSPTASLTATPGETTTPTGTPSATATVSFTPVQTVTHTPSGAPSATPTSSPPATGTGTPTSTETSTPTLVPEATPSATATGALLPSPTASPAATATASIPPTAIASATPSATVSNPTPGTPSPTPTATGGPPVCVGDCNGDGDVTVDELVLMVTIALGNRSVSACVAGDADVSGEITIEEILTAVNHSLGGCSP